MERFCPTCLRSLKYSAPRTRYVITEKGRKALEAMRKQS